MTIQNKNSFPNSEGLSISIAKPEDVEDLLPAIRSYFSEIQGRGGLTLDEDKAVASTKYHIEHAIGRALVVRAEDKVVGFVLMIYDDQYTVETTATVYAIYVLPKWRKSRLPRQLLACAELAAEADGASIIVAEDPDTLGGGKSFANLMSKRGYTPYTAAYKRLKP